MKVIIIDDEKAMHLVMRKFLAMIPNVEVIGSFQDTIAASSFLDDHPAQLAFVDISMPKESGMLFAKRMAENNQQLHIVFVTSHKDYAVDAFDIMALDYIVKPVTLERLRRTVNKAMDMPQFPVAEKNEQVMGGLSIYFLGGLEVRTPNGTVKWMSRKSAELFGYLLFQRGRMVSRVRITADIFGGMPQGNADIYLNTTIYQLRRSLEPHGLRSIVNSNSDSYGLEISDVPIDFVAFESSLRGLNHIEASNLDQAIEVEKLYVGDLFGEKGFLWAMNDIERLSMMYTAFVKRMAIFILKRSASDIVAISLLHKLLSRNELDEEVVSLLLGAYAANKDKGSFNKQYLHYVKLLRKELGLGPSLELEARYSLLRSEFKVD